MRFIADFLFNKFVFIIYKLYLGQSISPLLNGKAKATELVRSLRKKN